MTRILLLAALLAAALAARRRLLVVRVHGASMRPTYEDGDLLLAARTPLIRPGRPVVFRTPDPARHDLDGPDDLDSLDSPADPPYRVKRVAAVPGDPTPSWLPDRRPGELVPDGRIVVRGDADNSEDSRHYGYITRDDVLAVVLARVRKAA